MAELAAFFESELGIDVIAIRMVAAAILGGIIGFEREYLARPAGMRTHILVALAAATFAVVTLELMAHANAEGVTSTDPIRVIEAVTAGVAFLAAGTIIFSRGEVHGLTTGASLWLSGAIGVACGIGYYFIAVLATVLAFFVLTVLRWVEKAMPQKEEPPEAEKSAAEAKD
jgi:putative Mg2+ transporter-C (MgtC) family protein